MTQPQRPAPWPESSALSDDLHADGAGYVDAATFALRFASVTLGRADAPVDHTTSPAPVVTGERLREVMGSLVTGVCVVTTTWEGEDVAMTANSVTSVSLDPPLLLVCVARTARFHAAIISAPTWGVSILDADAIEVSARFSRPGRGRSGQLDGLGHHRGPVTGVALVDSSCAALECRAETVHPGGDHSIVVGRVVGLEKQQDPRHPLVFHQGQYRWFRS